MNNNEINPSVIDPIGHNSKQPQKFSSTLKAGYILCLITSIMGVMAGGVLMILGLVAFVSNPASFNMASAVTKEQLTIVGIIYFVIGAILFAFHMVILVYSAKNLNNQNNERHWIFIAVCSIIFGGLLGIIGGILILVGRSDPTSNTQNSPPSY